MKAFSECGCGGCVRPTSPTLAGLRAPLVCVPCQGSHVVPFLKGHRLAIVSLIGRNLRVACRSAQVVSLFRGFASGVPG